MKKTVLMGFVLLVTIGVSLVFAQAPTLDKLNFVPRSEGGYDVRAVNRNINGAVVIPATADGRNGNQPVTMTAGNAFQNCPGITTVTILGNNMTLIAQSSFENCTGLTSVTIPASVNQISTSAFRGCTSLTSVTFLGTANLANSGNMFPGDLREKYNAGGAGTYTRQRGSDTWTKQGGDGIVCPHCGQLIPGAVWR